MSRPVSENSKRHRLEIRLNDEELSAVQYIAKELGTSLSGAVLDAVMYRSEEIFRARQGIRRDPDD